MISAVDLRPNKEIQAQLDEAYRRVMRSGVYIGGEEVALFEQEFAEYLGAAECIGVGNGFDALQVILYFLRLRESGKFLMISGKTCLPTWMAAKLTDIYLIPSELLDKYSNINMFAIIVHLYGIPNVNELAKVYDRQTPFIVDAAQAHGAMIGDRKIGSWEGYTAFSFYPTKNLGGYGDGGAIVLAEHTASDAPALRKLANYGGPEQGINSRLDPLQAAFLRVKLAHLDCENRRRRGLAAAYMERLAGIEGLRLPEAPEDTTPCWHQFAVEVEGRDRIRAELLEAGVETLVHYPEPPYKLAGYDYHIPEVERWCRQTMSLPMGEHIGMNEVDYICEQLRRITKP